MDGMTLTLPVSHGGFSESATMVLPDDYVNKERRRRLCELPKEFQDFGRNIVEHKLVT